MQPIRETAHKIIQAALKAVDPFEAVCTHLTRQDNTLTCGTTRYNLSNYNRVRVIGFGKGSAPMAHAVHSILADKITDGMVIVKYGHVLPPNIDISPIELVEAGHPVPDDKGLAHTGRLIDFLADSTPQDLILCLVSGGGSALLTQPVKSVSLTDLQTLTQHLLNAGASITEINGIRKHLSRVKGGKLAKLAHPATTISLILSDVGGDPLDSIASGPTTPDTSTFEQALTTLNKYNLTETTPLAILNYLQQGAAGQHPETPNADNPVFETVQNHIVANNPMAIAAAVKKARELGFAVTTGDEFIENEARDVALKMVEQGQQLRQTAQATQTPQALILGGETTVTIRGNGLGG